MGKIVKLNPLILEKVWGGQKLKEFQLSNQYLNIGETWEIATLKEGSSFLDDRPLNEICELSYVVKFIDTSENLSIQVHPDDQYAQLNEQSKGKTESWLILDAEDGAGVYLGFKKGVTKKEFATALKSGVAIDQFLEFYPVEKGDFLLVPAGAIHAIGKGVTLCEVQQASGITYRVWDWNRMGLDGKPRELHIEKAMESIQFGDSFYQNEVKRYQMKYSDLSGINTLFEHKDYKIEFFSNLSSRKINLSLDEKDSVIVLDGEIGGDINLVKYQTSLVLVSGTFEFEVNSNSKFIVVKSSGE